MKFKRQKVYHLYLFELREKKRKQYGKYKKIVSKNNLKQRSQSSLNELKALEQSVSRPRPLDGPMQATPFPPVSGFKFPITTLNKSSPQYAKHAPN